MAMQELGHFFTLTFIELAKFHFHLSGQHDTVQEM